MTPGRPVCSVSHVQNTYLVFENSDLAFTAVLDAGLVLEEESSVAFMALGFVPLHSAVPAVGAVP